MAAGYYAKEEMEAFWQVVAKSIDEPVIRRSNGDINVGMKIGMIAGNVIMRLEGDPSRVDLGPRLERSNGSGNKTNLRVLSNPYLGEKTKASDRWKRRARDTGLVNQVQTKREPAAVGSEDNDRDTGKEDGSSRLGK
ncbi:hypothetical protein Q3G72_009071 [Acer saccharum]|nr:hypothetical protein Q3G72_009071 [Acer saccharum]